LRGAVDKVATHGICHDILICKENRGAISVQHYIPRGSGQNLVAERDEGQHAAGGGLSQVVAKVVGGDHGHETRMRSFKQLLIGLQTPIGFEHRPAIGDANVVHRRQQNGQGDAGRKDKTESSGGVDWRRRLGTACQRSTPLGGGCQAARVSKRFGAPRGGSLPQCGASLEPARDRDQTHPDCGSD
jgi:hypothetical protein